METLNSGTIFDSDLHSDGDRNTKKVRFKDAVGGEDTNMAVVSSQEQNMSFKDKLLGGSVVPDRDLVGSLGKNEGKIEFLKGDVNTSMVNGIPAIALSDRIKGILFKEMELTLILKLLWRNISYNVLHNRILNLWKPTKLFHLMDITNGYFLAKFQDVEDYNRVLSQGLWILFGQYLTVQPWTQTFNPAQPYSSVVMAWIRLPGLPGYLYKRKIIEAIGSLISKILVKGAVQKVEYEALPTVYFSCGKYDHVKEVCSSMVIDPVPVNLVDATMLVERKSRHGQRDSQANMRAKSRRKTLRSRFLPLNEEEMAGSNLGMDGEIFSGEKNTGKGFVIEKGSNVRVSCKGDLGLIQGVGNGYEVGPSSVSPNSMDSIGLAVEAPNLSRIGEVKSGFDKEDSILKALGKRHVGLNGLSHLGKDFDNNLISPNNSSPFLPAGSTFGIGSTQSRLGCRLENLLDLWELGCVSPKFPRIFWEYNRKHKPDLIGLLETRVSGAKADSVIAKLGFKYSHRVEAEGFSGGIWIGWKNSISVEILGNHSQFIFLKIFGNPHKHPVLVTFVYGSPNRFKRFVKKHWDFQGNMSNTQASFTAQVKTWNKDVFGHVIHRKNLLKKKLDNIQKAIDRRSSTYLDRVEMDIRGELEEVLHHEELIWRQKARCNWLVFGHRNTRFFHRKALQRRKHNRIVALKNQEDEWIMVRSAFPSLDQDEIHLLSSPILDEEIKKALFSMAPLKSPGSDGFYALFYQSQWAHVGPSICRWVKQIFDGESIDLDLNNSLIVLIHKVNHPKNFSQFRPISLCSVLYKLVMKIIANRFKVVFPKIIGPEQAGFVAGRNINDNIIIMQEVIHSMKSKQKNKRWMAIKIDLEKVYDRVRWNFIDASLQVAEWQGHGVHAVMADGSLIEWLELNLRNKQAINLTGGVSWSCLFGIIIWRMWKNRNLRIFQGVS
ncbi:hypothetical protein J1N35_033866 [Gossypium stocksii]|uniref:Reverse transcriptase domain-containing protein n=1 Tax=Gossypium stocksii TaxID=47602 RepID=A0A9D3UQX1_9ROSI|nr:hypothetical protein J1N35_033866 [Gossypium stocksii]